jgi:hypothetical protein
MDITPLTPAMGVWCRISTAAAHSPQFNNFGPQISVPQPGNIWISF